MKAKIVLCILVSVVLKVGESRAYQSHTPESGLCGFCQSLVCERNERTCPVESTPGACCCCPQNIQGAGERCGGPNFVEGNCLFFQECRDENGNLVLPDQGVDAPIGTCVEIPNSGAVEIAPVSGCPPWEEMNCARGLTCPTGEPLKDCNSCPVCPKGPGEVCRTSIDCASGLTCQKVPRTVTRKCVRDSPSGSVYIKRAEFLGHGRYATN